MAKSDDDKLSGANDVGYRKPSAHSRFKRGKSGNPNGRPKGTLNFATTLIRTLREPVVINENGRRKQITKLEAAVKQLVNKAASGDLRALARLIDVMLLAEQRAADETASKEALSELDKKLMSKMLKRYEQATPGGNNCENPVP